MVGIHLMHGYCARIITITIIIITVAMKQGRQGMQLELWP